MNSFRKLFGIIFVATIIVCAMAACNPFPPDPDDPISPTTPPTTVTGIALTTPPAKTQYNLGEELDTTGMVVKANYSDGSTTAVTGYTTSGYDKTTLGNQSVTVTYSGKTAEFTVNVIDPNKPTVATPTPSVAAGTYNAAQSVTLSCATENATIYYTNDGNNPTVTSSKYSGAISIGATTTLKAIATKEGMNDSGILTAVYTVSATSTPTFTSVAAFKTWLDAQPANSANTAYNIALNISSLGDSQTTSGSVGKALADNLTKYVSLNLSGSTFSSIGQNAFSVTNLTGVTIPNSVTSIGDYAFAHCIGLTSVTIPDSVTRIGVSAFWRCETLPSINIPNSVTSIGGGAFAHCYKLVSITVGTANTAYSLQDGVLYNKGKTVLHTYPAGKTASSFTVPNNITKIGDNAFGGCTGLTSVTIPNSVTYIGNGAFMGCTSLTGITIPNSITCIEYDAFRSTALTSVTIPDSVTSIEDWAFMSCVNLASVTIPNSVTSIGGGAFYGCNSLTSVNFEGTISSSNFDVGGNFPTFPGDLRDKYLAGGPGTYTRPNGSDTWTRTGGGDAPGGNTPGAYIITKDSYGGFTATKDGATIIQTTYINEVIGGIKTHATGTNPTIQFGNGNLLDIGTAKLEFTNSGSTWGLITLTGKITSFWPYDTGTFDVRDSVSVTSSADIANSGGYAAIWHNSTGTLTISGGTITSPLYNTSTGTVNITGGTVTVSDIAVYNVSGKIIVSGTAKVTSASTNTAGGTIFLVNSSATTPRLEITGGRVENTSTTSGNAIRNDSKGTVSITGGTVSKAGDGNFAVFNGGIGTVTIGAGATIVGNKYGVN